MAQRDERLLTLGRISGLYGVRGWVRIYSYTEPRENIVDYPAWQLSQGGRTRTVEVEQGRSHGKGVVAKLVGVEDRDQARLLIGAEIAVDRDQLPAAEEGEYYWADLEGLRVVTTGGVELGRVDHLLETGANDVLVVQGERERLIPFVQDQVVTRVDLAQGYLQVDWDPDF